MTLALACIYAAYFTLTTFKSTIKIRNVTLK